MDKCKNCGQDLEKNDKFCRNCGQVVEVEIETQAIEEVSQETVVPNFNKEKDNNTLDISLIEKARKEQIKKELEDYKNRNMNLEQDNEKREYKDYELEKTQVIGDINQYIDEEEIEEKNGDKKEKIYFKEEDYSYNKKPKKLNSKLIIGITIGIFIVLGIIISLMLGGKNNLSKEELIENYIKALNNRNESEIVGLLESPTPEMKIDKDGIHAYFRYIDENPSYIEKVKFQLEEQSKFYDKNKSKDIGDRFENVVLRNKDGNYFLEIKPYYLNVKLASPDVKLYLDDKLLDTTSSANYEKEFGPYMPGIYDLRGELVSGSNKDEVVEKVVLYEESPAIGKLAVNVELDLKLASFRLKSNNQEAFIITNGTKTNTRVKDLPNGVFGPVSGSTKLQLVLDSPFGELKSKEIVASQVKDEVSLDIDFTSDVIFEGLSKSINTFIKEDAMVMASLDTSIYTNIGEPELSKKTAMVDEMIDLNQSIESVLHKNIYDLNSLEIKEEDGVYHGTVVVKTELEQTYLADFSVEKSDDPKYGQYYAYYDNGKKTWIINNVENASNFNLANTKEYKF